MLAAAKAVGSDLRGRAVRNVDEATGAGEVRVLMK